MSLVIHSGFVFQVYWSHFLLDDLLPVSPSLYWYVSLKIYFSGTENFFSAVTIKGMVPDTAG